VAVRKRRVRGVASVRKLLRQLPDDAKNEIIVELNVSGREMLPRMQGRAPYKTGATRSGLSFKVLPKSLRLQIGLLGTKAGRSKLFYARIQDLGRKAQVVTVRRFRAGGQRLYFRGHKFGPSVQMYPMHVPFMKGKRFVTGGMRDLRVILQRNLKNIWSQALRKFTSAGDD
jgi:hypothetical protein